MKLNFLKVLTALPFIFFLVAFKPLSFVELQKHTSEFEEKSKKKQLSSADFNALSKKLENWQDKKLRIRGFVYKNQQDQLVLSSEPGLKSCCQGSRKKMLSQIYMNGEASKVKSIEPGKSYLVEGLLKLEPGFEEQGRIFVLNEAKIIPEKERGPMVTTLFSGIVICLIGAFLFFKFKS